MLDLTLQNPSKPNRILMNMKRKQTNLSTQLINEELIMAIQGSAKSKKP
jgi:hypothetical protein